MLEEKPEDVPLADPGGKLVLIVDDDEGVQDIMSHIVKKEGFKIAQAKNGREAIKQISAATPDLIILDLMLPGMGGYEVVREIQATDAARTPVIMITGREITRSNLEMIKQEPNVREMMQKPVNNAILAATIHSILKTRPPEFNRQDRGPMSGKGF